MVMTTEIDWKNPDIDLIAKVIGTPFDNWAHQCHVISFAIMNAFVPTGRIARGWCQGVRGQHSWIVDDEDVYSEWATIIDPTLWSYDDSITGIWYGTAEAGKHSPHGEGSIWDSGCPQVGDGDPIELTPKTKLSNAAKGFLDMVLGNNNNRQLDRQAWSVLANGPMGGWPSGEIIAAMDDTVALSSLVPVDILGMVTDRNPGGLYLPKGTDHV